MRIFLSYASEDRQVAEQIQLALVGAKHDVFFDKESLPSGGDYHDRIRKEVKRSDLFVFLISPNSVAHGSYALTELGYAREKWAHPKGKIIPVNLSGVPLKSVPNYLTAVTILEPEGNPAAEILSAVEKARKPRRFTIALCITGAMLALGIVLIEYKNQFKPPPKLDVFEIRLPRNNEKEQPDEVFKLAEMDSKIVEVFDRLIALDDQVIYIRFSTYVGAGFGIEDVPKSSPIRAGVVFTLKGVDGFGGNINDYEYGYVVELPSYRKEWRNSRNAILLFPKAGNAFFTVHYMKSMNFDGLAKVRISGMQGTEFIEIIPVTPTDDLLLAYNEVRKKIGKLDIWEF